MIVFRIDPLGTTSILGTSITVTNTVKNSDTKSATISSLSALLVTSMARPETMYINLANRYVDSLTDTQLQEISNKLEQKEQLYNTNIHQLSEEKPKVYQKI